MRTIAVINQKGGSGKTTTAINLAGMLARMGRRTLLVDVDPQAHCSLGLAIPDERVDCHIGDAMLADSPARMDLDRLIWHIAPNFDLIPSSMRLAALEAARGGLAGLEDRDQRLARVLAPLSESYEWCVIDCPPSIGLLTYNALRAAGEVLIPVEMGFFALHGAEKQIGTIRSLQRRFGAITPYRVLATMFDPESPLARDILRETERRFAEHLVPVTIRFDPKLKEAASIGQTIGAHSPTAPGSMDYGALAAWLTAQGPPEAMGVSWEHAPIDDLFSDGPTGSTERPETPLPLSASAPMSDAAFPRDPGAVVMSRAAELASRAKALSRQSEQLESKLRSDPGVSRAMVELAAATTPDPTARRETDLSRVFGVRQTSQGVLFVQPGGPYMTVCIAGDHNGWSATQTPMRYNPHMGVHERLLKLPGGVFRYRLVVNGQWMTDPYNPRVQQSRDGGLESVVIIEQEECSHAGADGSSLAPQF